MEPTKIARKLTSWRARKRKGRARVLLSLRSPAGPLQAGIAAFLLVCSFGVVTDSPAQTDPLSDAGFSYVSGLRGEYFNNWELIYPMTAISSRHPTNTPDPWSTNPDGCPLHINTGAATREDGMEAYVSTQYTGNALTLGGFMHSAFTEPEIRKVTAWVRYMCRRNCISSGTPDNDCTDAGEFTTRICQQATNPSASDDTADFYVIWRGVSYNTSAARLAQITANRCDENTAVADYRDYQWSYKVLCSDDSGDSPILPGGDCASAGVDWQTLGEDLQLRMYVTAGATAANWHWIMWEVGLLEIVTDDPGLWGTRMDENVDFGTDGSPAGVNYERHWRTTGAPATMLRNRSNNQNNRAIYFQSTPCDATVTPATDAEVVHTGGTAGCNGVDANNLSTYFEGTNRAVGSGAGDYWARTWQAQQKINRVKVWWKDRVGAPNRASNLYILYCTLSGAGNNFGYSQCTAPASATLDAARIAGWEVIAEVPSVTVRYVTGYMGREEAYTFPTVETDALMLFVPGACDDDDCELRFWEFHAYEEMYDYFEARWAGEVWFDTPGNQHICTIASDGTAVWVGDDLVIDSWVLHATPTKLDGYTANLDAGWHRIEMKYFEWTGDASARLGECSDGSCTNCVPIPSSRLRASWGGLSNYSFLGGWFGNFWNGVDANFNNLFWYGFEHTPDINFEWEKGVPCALKETESGDTWSARYSGYIRAEYTGTYSICLTADDGAVLWIDPANPGNPPADTPTIDNVPGGFPGGWGTARAEPLRVCKQMSLSEGEHYAYLQVYDSNSETATLKLEWVPTADDLLEPYGGRSALHLKVVNDHYLGMAVDGTTRVLYHFNEGDDVVLRDFAGFPQDGTIDGPVWYEEGLGKVFGGGTVSGLKLKFDGVWDFVAIYNHADLDIAGSLTVEAWVKPAFVPPTNPWSIVKKEGTAANNANYKLQIQNGTGRLQFVYRPDSEGANVTCTGSANIADNQWHYVAAALENNAAGDDYVRLYVDDWPQDATCNVGAHAAPTINVDWVMIGLDGGDGYTGLIDELRISAGDLSVGGTTNPADNLGFADYNSYSYREFDPSQVHNVAGGPTQECLEFDVFLSRENPTYDGGFDAMVGALTVRDNYNWTDQNGAPIHPSTVLDGVAYPGADAVGKWYHRCFDIDSADGNALQNPKIAFEGDLTGPYSIMLDNIKVTQDCVITPGSPGTCTPGSPMKTFYEIGAPARDIDDGTTQSVVFSELDSYSQEIEPIPADFLYAGGLRRMLYETAFESKAGGEVDYFDRMICTSIDAVVDHQWMTAGIQEPEVVGNNLLTGSASSLIPMCQGKAREDNWAMRWQGAVYVPSDGNHGFQLQNVNNRARLIVDNETWIGWCGSLASETPTTCQNYAVDVLGVGNNLTQGWHSVDIDFLEGPGVSPTFDAQVHFRWDIGSGWQVVPMNRLAMRQLIPGAYLNQGGSGRTDQILDFGRFATDMLDQAMNMMYDMMGAMGMGCSTVIGGPSPAEARFARAARNLGNYVLTETGLRAAGEEISRKAARAVETSPVLHAAARVLSGPARRAAEVWKNRCRQEIPSALFTRTPVFPGPGCPQ